MEGRREGTASAPAAPRGGEGRARSAAAPPQPPEAGGEDAAAAAGASRCCEPSAGCCQPEVLPPHHFLLLALPSGRDPSPLAAPGLRARPGEALAAVSDTEMSVARHGKARSCQGHRLRGWHCPLCSPREEGRHSTSAPSPKILRSIPGPLERPAGRGGDPEGPQQLIPVG